MTGVDHQAYESPGVVENLPVFYAQLLDRQGFPLSWTRGDFADFDAWREEARAKVSQCLLTPPPAVKFNPKVIDEEDRGTYAARKVTFNVTGDSRVLGYLLVPKSDGAHPAVLLLHDHGARFDIGKEKMIRPFGEPEKLASAEEWTEKHYGGVWIGDELAKRGYACFSADMLNWSDRGGAGYEAQHALAANLMHMGMSLAGLIAHEDLRTSEFLASLPEVDGKRIAAVGLSIGGYRTWQLAALTDRIAAGIAVCWMTTIRSQMQPGIHQTGGQSVYTILHPGLHNYLDFPDIASIACPKPMVFYAGRLDTLFPVPGVEDAYRKIRQVWQSQNAGDKLITKLWDVPHEFNLAMQAEAFDWLDGWMR